MNSKLRNIGGSLLPSSDSRILTPIKFKGGCLTVKPDSENDTHHLVFEKSGNYRILASHANGYSCHSLAERIISGDAAKILAQLKYIDDCGGTALSLMEIEQIIAYSKLVPIFFFDGAKVRATEVLRSDLPALSGTRSFWRELPEDETEKILKARIGRKMASLAKTGLNTA